MGRGNGTAVSRTFEDEAELKQQLSGKRKRKNPLVKNLGQHLQDVLEPEHCMVITWRQKTIRHIVKGG